MEQNREENGKLLDKDEGVIDIPTELDEKKDRNKINSIKSNGNDPVAQYTKVDCDESPTERVTFFGLEKNDSICSDDSNEEAKLPLIPDGGWGWVVVVSAFLVSACADGLGFCFGLLHEEFTVYFETTQSKTSMIGSFFIATPLLAGPIMSALVDRYGCRIMTMLAGVLSTATFLLAAVSNSIEMLCLTLGFMSGLAMGVFYVTAVVSVAFWFDKRRNLALSLASCGIGFGTLIYSPMTTYLLEMYDWRNTLVFLAGTILNMCVCGALMRSPEWLAIKTKRVRKLSRSKSGRSSSNVSTGSSIGAESMLLSADELKALMKSGQSPEYILSTLTTIIAEAEKLEATTQMNAEQAYKRIHSAIHLPTFIQQNKKVPVEVIEKLMTNKRLYNIILQNYSDIMTRRKSEVEIAVEQTTEVVKESLQLPVTIKIKKPRMESECKKSKEIMNENNKTEQKIVRSNKTLTKSNIKLVHDKLKNKPHTLHNLHNAQPTKWSSRQISMDHHYLRNMHLYRNTLMHRGAMLNIPKYKLRALSLPEIYRNSMWYVAPESDDETRWYHRLFETFNSTFDFRMYTEFHFLMFNLSALILSVWFVVPYYFLKSYMTASGVEGGALMISVIGVASSIGIVVLGWAGDQPWVNVTKSYAVCLILCGLSVAAYPPFITNYWAVAVISTIFGLSFASSYSYTPAILMELMPIDNFTVAYGMIMLSMGIGHLVGPPLGGLLFDVTGTWDLTFYMGGLFLVISGLCVGVIPYTENLRMCGYAPLLKGAEEKSECAAEA